MTTTKITKSQNKEIILENADQIEGRRWTKQQVVDLSIQIDDMGYEEARIFAFCEVNGWLLPEDGECETLEDFKKLIEE